MKARLKPLGLYAGAVALCLVLLAYTLRLWHADLHFPFLYYGDAVWCLAWVKGMLENGWYLHNDYLGAPGAMDLHDFPVLDSLFFLMLKLLVHATRDPVVAYNLFFLLGFPLTTLTSLFVLRRLRVPAGPAVLASLLYTFQPYHFLRGEGHLFLASYFLVPLAVLMVLRVYLGERLNRAGAVVVCLLLGCGGVYYAFFTCFFLAVAGVAAAAQRRRLQPLATAGVLGAFICLAVGANLVPTWLYQRQHGRNPVSVVRDPMQADLLGLKAAQMLLPVDSHGLHRLAEWKARYNKQFLPTWYEGAYSTVGLAAGIGFLVLAGRLLVRKPFQRPGLADGLTTLNAAALMLACVGGAGSLFSLYATPWIRAYCRICIFIAFFALVALARLLNRLDRYPQFPAWRWCYFGGLAAVLALGIADQCPAWFIPPYGPIRDVYTAEAEFVGRIEATLPAGSMVFQLPACTFPEGMCREWFAATDLFRPYLHSHGLRWSYGTMRGREGDRWREEVSKQPLPEMVAALVRAGFRGILVDRAGYFDLATRLEPQLSRLLGEKPLVSTRDQRYYFFDLTAYAARLRGESSSPTPVIDTGRPGR
jgi:phosphoglycerol transferase